MPRVTTPKGILLPAAVSKAIRDRATAFSVPLKIQPPDGVKAVNYVVHSSLDKSREGRWSTVEYPEWIVDCPHAPGDVVFLKEPYATDRCYDHLPAAKIVRSKIYCGPSLVVNWHKRRPAATMPAKFARTWLRIKSVACVRVCETTDSEARNEGICLLDERCVPVKRHRLYKKFYREFWQSVFPRHPWETTWVWRYQVELTPSGRAAGGEG